MKHSRALRMLAKDLRSLLIQASDRGRITNSISDIIGLVRGSSNGLDEVIECPKDGRNFGRRRDAQHFARDDGAWFDFVITLRQGEVIAYSFELRLPEDARDGPSWIRFDLNPPGHDNDHRGHRSHLHLASDDDGMSISHPRQTPAELMDFMVRGLRRTGRVRGATVGG